MGGVVAATGEMTEAAFDVWPLLPIARSTDVALSNGTMETERETVNAAVQTKIYRMRDAGTQTKWANFYGTVIYRDEY